MLSGSLSGLKSRLYIVFKIFHFVMKAFFITYFINNFGIFFVQNLAKFFVLFHLFVIFYTFDIFI